MPLSGIDENLSPLTSNIIMLPLPPSPNKIRAFVDKDWIVLHGTTVPKAWP